MKVLPVPVRAADQAGAMLAHPGAPREVLQQRLVRAAHRIILDVFHTGGHAEFGLLQPPREAAILTVRPLMIDQQSEALVKRQCLCVGLLRLREHGFRHAH
jgi:hypothetical protein